MRGTVFFHSDQLIQMAQFCAELARQQVCFESAQERDGWLIILTGGH